MRWADLRGVVAFALAVAAIAYAWQWIEDRPVETTLAVTTPSTTTIAPIVAVTTTTTPLQAIAAMCARTETFVAEAGLIPGDRGPGPLARLALSYWSDLSLVAFLCGVEVPDKPSISPDSFNNLKDKLLG